MCLTLRSYAVPLLLLACGLWTSGHVLAAASEPAGASTFSIDRAAIGLRAAVRAYDECQRSDDGLGVCAKLKVIALLARASRADSIALSDDVRLERVAGSVAADTIGHLDDANWEETLPRSAAGREEMVNDVLLKRVASFLSCRSVTVRLPGLSALDIGRGFEEGGFRVLALSRIVCYS